MKKTQGEDLLRQANMRSERNATRAQCGLDPAPEDEAWQQKLIDKHMKAQEELLVEQKAQFVEVYGKDDQLAETIWSWRGADQLAAKLDEVVPAVAGKLESPADVAKELSDLCARQDAYHESQETRIKTDERVKKAQAAALEELLNETKQECDELMGKIGVEEDAKLAAFAAAGDAAMG